MRERDRPWGGAGASTDRQQKKPGRPLQSGRPGSNGIVPSFEVNAIQTLWVNTIIRIHPVAREVGHRITRVRVVNLYVIHVARRRCATEEQFNN